MNFFRRGGLRQDLGRRVPKTLLAIMVDVSRSGRHSYSYVVSQMMMLCYFLFFFIIGPLFKSFQY